MTVKNAVGADGYWEPDGGANAQITELENIQWSETSVNAPRKTNSTSGGTKRTKGFSDFTGTFVVKEKPLMTKGDFGTITAYTGAQITTLPCIIENIDRVIPISESGDTMYTVGFAANGLASTTSGSAPP